MNKLFHNGIGLNTARHGYRLGDSGVAEPPAALDRAHTHHLVFRLRYPLTLFFGLVIILILGISSGFLISRAASGANDQLIRTLEAEIEEDLTRDLERLRRSGVDISIDPQVSDGLLDTWIAEVSRDIGASVAVLFDLDGMPVWSSDPAHGGSGDFEAKDVDIALARGVVTEMVRNVQLVDADGRYYISDAMETYLPLFNASGDAEIGVLEVYVDVRDELAAAGRAARTNISNVVIEVMVAVGLSLIGTVFIVELLLNRARRMQLEEESRRAETAASLARVESQAREAEVAKHERERFLSLVSHELKTPLTSVLAFADILSRDRDETLTETQKQQLELVKRNGRRLDALIDDVLDVSRIETGRLTLEVGEFDLGELVDDLTASLASIFHEKSQVLVVAASAGEIRVRADRNRIFQAVSNILSNASKYSPENSTISLDATVDDSRLRISVADEGAGLTEYEQKRIFDLFYRASNERTRAVAGLGVGLALVKAIVELHDGSVTVDSAPGEGSTFTIEISGVVAVPEMAAAETG